jgi:hypothetical protein
MAEESRISSRFQYSLATYFVLTAIMATFIGFIALATQSPYALRADMHVGGGIIAYGLLGGIFGFILGCFHRPVLTGLLWGAFSGFIAGAVTFAVLAIPLPYMNNALVLSGTGTFAIILAALVGRWNR